MPYDDLTDAQRDCLRLVLTHHNSKEIASMLGVSPSAVDKRIERAVQVMGATTRFAAARMLSAYEGGPTSERLTSEPFDLPVASDDGAASDPDEPWWLVRRLFGLDPTAGSGGRVRNRLSRPHRLGVIVLLVVFIAVTVMALLNIGQTLSTMAMAHRTVSARQP